MLSLGVQVSTKIMVGEHELEVLDIKSIDMLILQVDGERTVVVSDKERIELWPDVYVQTGASSTSQNTRLAIAAPRSVKILRL